MNRILPAAIALVFLLACAPINTKPEVHKKIALEDLKGTWLWAETSRFSYAVLDLKVGGRLRFYIGSIPKPLLSGDATVTGIKFDNDAITISFACSGDPELYSIPGKYDYNKGSLSLEMVPQGDEWFFLRPVEGFWPCDSEVVPGEAVPEPAGNGFETSE